MAEGSSKNKRYNLVMPEELFNEIQKIADNRNTTVVEMLRKFIKIGLLVVQAEETPGSALLIREGETEREIILV
jgi:hypothetical protein